MQTVSQLTVPFPRELRLMRHYPPSPAALGASALPGCGTRQTLAQVVATSREPFWWLSQSSATFLSNEFVFSQTEAFTEWSFTFETPFVSQMKLRGFLMALIALAIADALSVPSWGL